MVSIDSALRAERPMRPGRSAPFAATHQPQVVAPFFAGKGEGLTLHRYFDEDFVARFLNDAQAGRLTGTAAQPWFHSDRFGRFSAEPTLRLPLHLLIDEGVDRGSQLVQSGYGAGSIEVIIH